MMDHIIIEDNTIKYLFDRMNDVRFHFYSGKSIGDLRLLNIRVNVVPFYKDNILLMQYTDRNKYRYAKIPNRIVTLPDFVDYREIKDRFQQVLINNAYISMVDVYSDPNDVMDWFHEGPLSLVSMLSTKGLNTTQQSVEHFSVYYDEEEEWTKPWRMPHCVDIFVFIWVSGVRKDFEWVIVPKREFETYYQSKYPEAYLSSFTDIMEYDEKDKDFRMNKFGKKCIHNAFSCLDRIWMGN